MLKENIEFLGALHRGDFNVNYYSGCDWRASVRVRSDDSKDAAEFNSESEDLEECVSVLAAKVRKFLDVNPEFDPNKTIEYTPPSPPTHTNELDAIEKGF